MGKPLEKEFEEKLRRRSEVSPPKKVMSRRKYSIDITDLGSDGSDEGVGGE